MAFIYKKGDLLAENVDALVNTVNTVGVMGKGIALQFKAQFPLNYKLYRTACKKGEVQVGKMFLTATEKFIRPYFIINFPTKKHWRAKSDLEFVIEGLDDLIHIINKNKIKSIAIPPLGCGNGGLNWSQVKEIIENKLKNLSKEIDVIIYEPSFVAKTIRHRNTSIKKPKLTIFRAMLLASMLQYLKLGYDITILEAQKLAYFLERLGNDFQLDFTKHHYGPYSDKLRHVLNGIDGYYLNGMNYGTAKPFDKLSLDNANYKAINEYINTNCTATQIKSLQTLYQLIQGFETPLGMELLSSVDFLIHTNPSLIKNLNAIEKEIQIWNSRKRKLMPRKHLAVTLQQLNDFKKELYPSVN